MIRRTFMQLVGLLPFGFFRKKDCGEPRFTAKPLCKTPKLKSLNASENDPYKPHDEHIHGIEFWLER